MLVFILCPIDIMEWSGQKWNLVTVIDYVKNIIIGSGCIIVTWLGITRDLNTIKQRGHAAWIHQSKAVL